jgi:hypothetical protein
VSILVSNSDVISKMQTIATVHLSWITIQNGNCVLEHQFVAQATGPSVRSPQANCPISWTFELQFGQLSQRMKKARLLRPANQEPAIARLFWSSKYSKPVTKRNLIATVRGVPGIATLTIKRSIRSISLSETPTRTSTQVLACVRPFFDWSFSHSTMISYDI